MACKDKYGHLPLLSKTQCLSIETITVSFCQPETSDSVGTRRQIMVILHLFYPETIKSNARKDRYGHLLPLSKTQCLSTETIAVSLRHSEIIKSNGTQRQIWPSAPFVEDSMSFDWGCCSLPFVIQRQSSLMARRDKYDHLLPLSKTQYLSTKIIAISPSSSRDNQVRWHVETVTIIRLYCFQGSKAFCWYT